MVIYTSYEIIRSAILDKLAAQLPEGLFYHSVQHTIDVETQAERIAINENICGHDIFLLKLACLYHDTGFLITYNDHEQVGWELAEKELASAGLKQAELDVINGLIMATRVPQKPLTKLEEIICDADLDYLGREDFWDISNNLFLEFKIKKIVKSEIDWNQLQVKFFKQHTYFTETSKKLRTNAKLEHLKVIEAKIENP